MSRRTAQADFDKAVAPYRARRDERFDSETHQPGDKDFQPGPMERQCNCRGCDVIRLEILHDYDEAVQPLRDDYQKAVNA